MLFLTGVPRSGTTWAARALHAAIGGELISEPCNWKARPERERWHLRYLPAEAPGASDADLAETREFAALVHETVRPDQPTVVKEVHTYLASELWAAEHERTVLLVRHPLAVAASWKELGYDVRFRSELLLAQPRLVDELLAPLADHLRASVSWAQDLGAYWGASYLVLERLSDRNPNWAWASHEALTADPRSGFRALLAGLPHDPDALDDFLTQSARARTDGEDAYATVRSADELGRWRTTLTAREQADVLAGAAPFGVLERWYETGDDLTPREPPPRPLAPHTTPDIHPTNARKVVTATTAAAATERFASHEAFTSDVVARIDATVRGALRGADTVALVNFPNHRNAGDSAIWLGALDVLRRAGVRIGYEAAWDTYDPAALRACVGDAPVLLNGGGNFGDLYAGQHGTRERVLAELRGNPVVQLPQSMHFRDAANLVRVQRLIEAHGDVTLLWREQASFDDAVAAFDTPSSRCPDLAFALAPLPRPAAASTDVCWVARRDPESTGVQPPQDPPDGLRLATTDWLDLLPGEALWPAGARASWELDRRVGPLLRRNSAVNRRLWPMAARAHVRLAEAWVRRGEGVLAQGRVVVTDRLHGLLLAMRCGIPAIGLDNTTGKVRAVYDADAHRSPLAHMASNAGDALVMARTILGQDRGA